MTKRSNPDRKATIVALATPLAESAIGLLRVSGPRAWEIASQLYRGKRPWERISPREAVVGYFLDSSGEVLDEVVWLLYQSPHSYTGEDIVEVMFHGNPWILLEAQKAFVEKGARLAYPGEFTERAYLNGKMDLNQAEAVNDLIRSHTRLAKSAALSQLQGKLSSVIREIHERLLSLLALVEAAIDHSDIEETMLDREGFARSLLEIQTRLARLLETAGAGKILRLGMKVAIVGAPNVGKSSLFNLLAQEDRAIVTDVAGTTRDTLEVEIQIQGIPFRLIDTAGIRESDDVVEMEGIRRSRRAIEEADLCLVVFDATRRPSEEEKGMVSLLRDRKALFLINKTENGYEPNWYDFLPEAVPISVKTHKNIDLLHEKLAHFYFDLGYNPQTDVLLTNQRQELLVRQAVDSLEEALCTLENGMSEEYVAHYLYRARVLLEEITGKTTQEDILDRIFSQFCIGK